MDLRSINKKLIKLHSDDVSNMKYMQLISFRDEKARVMYEHKEREFINLTNAQSLLISTKDLLSCHKRSIGFFVMSAIIFDLECFRNAF
jgi:hypothetical protein